MRPRWSRVVGATLIAPVLLIVTVGQQPGAGDEPSRLGRFFRFGSSSGSSGSSSAPAPPPSDPQPSAPASSYPAAPGAPAIIETAPPANPGASASPRIVPRPRVSRPVTESDPIITRVTLNRSDDGNIFGMFMQVYADGTIIDSEGVHHVSQDALKPLVDLIQTSDLYRQRGHCGAPATDYLESVQVIVYERSLGRLRANAFSYSGNPQGCDNAVRHLHGALDTLQAKIMRPMPGGIGNMVPPAGGVSSPSVPFTPPPPSPPTSAPLPAPAPAGSQTVIPLTAPN